MKNGLSRRDFARRIFSLGALSAASVAGLSALGGRQAQAQDMMGMGMGGASTGAGGRSFLGMAVNIATQVGSAAAGKLAGAKKSKEKEAGKGPMK